MTEWIWFDNAQYGKGPNNSTKIVQRALNSQVGTKLLVDGVYGNATRAAYVKWQNKLGFFGPVAADGNPGKTSITRLAAAEHFTVVYAGQKPPSNTPAPPTETPGGATPVPSTAGRIDPKQVTYTRFVGTFDLVETIKAACAANGYTYSDAWLRGYRTAMNRESGGNPNACNLWDSNARTPAGFTPVHDFGDGYTATRVYRMNGELAPFMCSRGPWQCIPQTFARYHAPGTSLSIYDPVASAAASMHYVVANYGVAKDGSNLASRVQQFDPNRPAKGY